MTRFAGVLLLSATLLGCYDPQADAPPGVESQAGECLPDGDLCSINADCCAWDGSSQSGAGLCVNFGEFAECTGICYGDGDCSEGCCAALTDTDAYGVCAACSANPFERPSNPGNACLDGVAYFCGCGDALGSPCGESRADFEANCSSVNELSDVFECYAANADLSCGDALAECPLESVAALSQFR